MQIDLSKLNSDTLFNLFATLDNIEQYYTEVFFDAENVEAFQNHKKEINKQLEKRGVRIIKKNNQFTLTNS